MKLNDNLLKVGLAQISPIWLDKEKTVAADLDYYSCGDQFKIEGFGDTIFTVTDNGSELGRYHFDIFIGAMHKEDFDRDYENQRLENVRVAKVSN